MYMYICTRIRQLFLGDTDSVVHNIRSQQGEKLYQRWSFMAAKCDKFVLTVYQKNGRVEI